MSLSLLVSALLASTSVVSAVHYCGEAPFASSSDMTNVSAPANATGSRSGRFVPPGNGTLSNGTAGFAPAQSMNVSSTTNGSVSSASVVQSGSQAVSSAAANAASAKGQASSVVVTSSSLASTPASSAAALATPTVISAAATDTNPNITAWLTLHNDFRAKYNADALTWNATLATYAQSWSDGCVFEHSSGGYGENLAGGAQFKDSDVFVMWSSESSEYDAANPVYSHFTQLVWKDTKQLGCAYTTCPKLFGDYDADLVVCEYYPPGNYFGEYAKNVEGTTCTDC